MAFNFSKLRGRIIELYGSQKRFAEEIGITEQTLSLKMSNKIRFTSDDIICICDLLSIPDEEINVYFFTQKV